MAYPIYQSTGGIGTGTDYAVDVPYPSIVNADDILIASIMDADNDTFNVPAGWTKIDEDGTHSNLSVAFYWKRADGTETGSVTFTSLLNSGSLVAGIMYRYSGCVKYGVPYENSSGAKAVTQSTTFTANPSVSKTNGQRLGVAFLIVEDNTLVGIWNNAHGYSEDSSLSTSTGSDAAFAAASSEDSSADSVISSGNGNEYYSSISLHLIPEGAVPVTLNTAEAFDFEEDTTPTLEFTPNAVSDLDNEVEIEIDTVNTFDSSVTHIDSSTDNSTGNIVLYNGSNTRYSYAFTGDGNSIERLSINMLKVLSPTGNITAEIWTQRGTYGTSSEPEDLLGSSIPVDVTTLSTSQNSVYFYFPDKIDTIDTTKYCFVIHFNDGDFSNFVRVFHDGAGTHDGDVAYTSEDNPNWTSLSNSNPEFQVSTRNPLIKALSSVLLDENNGSNDAVVNIDAVAEWVGQSFTGDGSLLSRAAFQLTEQGNITGGTLVAKLYSHTGTYGTSSNRLSLLATSEAINATDLPPTVEFTEFNFATAYKTIDNTKYVILIEVATTITGTSSPSCRVWYDDSTPSHSGNKCTNTGTDSGHDTNFRIWSDNNIVNTTDGTDVSPFEDNEKLSFTVESDDALPAPTETDTYYWRARAINPSGINIWDEWSSVKSFVLTESTGTNIQINKGDVWKAVTAIKINKGDVWKTVVGAQINKGDVWKTIF